MRAFRCQLPRANPFYADTPAPPSPAAPNSLSQAQQQLSLARDPWQVLAHEQQCTGGTAAAAAGPAVFSEQELIVEAEPEEEGEGTGDGGTGGQDSEVQR